MTDEQKDKPLANACVTSMQPKITVHLRRSADGEVVADILNEKDEVVAFKRFGMMTDDEYETAMQQIKQQFPGVSVWLLIDV